MPVNLTPEGKGRPDYSAHVSKTALPRLEVQNEIQNGYWATVEVQVPPYSGLLFKVEAGFTQNLAWIPEGTVFYVEAVEAFANNSSLMKLQLYYEKESNPGNYTAIGQTYGYGSAILAPKRSFTFNAGTRPMYAIVNYNTTEAIDVLVNIYGFTEKV